MKRFLNATPMPSLKRNSRKLWSSVAVTILIATPLLYVLTRHPGRENVLQILILTLLLPIFLIDFELGFLALIVLRPAMDTFSQVDFLMVGQFSLNLSSVVSLLVMAWILFYFMQKKSRVWKQPLFWPFSLFVLLSIISLFYTPSVPTTIREVVRVASIFFVYLMAGEVLTTRTRLNHFLKAVALSCIVPFVVAAYQFISGNGLSFAGVNNRIYGTLAHPNAFATYLVLIFSIGFSYILAQKNTRKNGWLIFGLLITFLFLLLTYTRGGWIGFIIVIVLLGLKYYKKLLIAFFGLAFFLILFGPALNRFVYTNFDYDFSRQPIIQRLLDKNPEAESSIDWRFKVWTEMSRKIWERPFFGYGLGAFPVIRQQYVEGLYESTEAHNDYLRLAIELGFAGLLLYLITLFKLIINLFRRLRTAAASTDRTWLYGGLAVVAAILVMSSSDNLLQGTANMWLLWSGMALLQKLPDIK